ncbi:MAG TPA: UDP-N-acetylglucosamine--N-acetylmuramyl-(pentapeptide) pyrophosphoryl-undecaprenol N-acetylglucosamine transferase [Elusimicrobiales bacterium]|nr:UDP-N-acetylglucosamine--N-acetylmuramyl-(pentapeptide) pyrophosphoryl-undecaprenol N-acetylglucosamine transferase [Elusimicrobiales bacterium]
MRERDGFRPGRIVIASGGTGGHFYPGLALAEELRAAGGWEPLFLVRKNDISIGALQERYYPYVETDVVSFPRGPSPLACAAFFRKLASSVLACARIFSDFRPDFVFGTGGYVSFPAVAAAALKGVPSMIHDSNAVLGLANRLSGRFASVVALGLPVARNPFASKTELTGTPIRECFSREIPPSAARRHFGLEDGVPVVLVFGGSQGSRAINQAALGAAKELTREGARFGLLHVTGRRDYAEIAEGYRKAGLDGLPRLKVLAYCDEMEMAYAAADLAVCRSGGGTISELSRFRKPSVLVPLPGSPGGHQKANAMVLASAGAAILLEERPEFAEEFSSSLRKLLSDPAGIDGLKRGWAGLDLPDPARAAGELRKIIERYQR